MKTWATLGENIYKIYTEKIFHECTNNSHNSTVINKYLNFLKLPDVNRHFTKEISVTSIWKHTQND